MHLLLAAALLPPVQAADLRLRLSVPGEPPQVVSVHDLQLGEQPDLVFLAGRRTRHTLSSTISQDDDGYRVAFVLERTRQPRLGKARTEVLARPTMVAPAGVWASFVMGGEEASVARIATAGLADSDSFEGFALHGYLLDWSISGEEAPAPNGTAEAAAEP